MKKYILVGLVGLMSMSVMAGKGHVERVKECDEYWKPIIAEVKETLNRLRSEWESMPPWEQKRDTRMAEMICKLQEQALNTEGARMVCYDKGLVKSKEVYESAW